MAMLNNQRVYNIYICVCVHVTYIIDIYIETHILV